MDAKTKEEIELLQELIDSPDTPQDEKELYRDTIKELKAEAEKAEKSKPEPKVEKKPETKKEEPKAKTKVGENQTIKDFYTNAFPTDPLGKELDDKKTFKDVWNDLLKGNSVYKTFGIGDSVVRERIFEQLAKLKKVDYDVIYDAWLSKGMLTESEILSKKTGKTSKGATKKEAPKKLPVDADKMKAEIKDRTGKTEEECEGIIAEYRQLREKSKKIEAKRLGKLDDEGKLIDGTKEKTAAAVIETAAENIKDKLEKQVDKMEKDAEKGNPTPDQIEARINKNLGQLSKEMTKQATGFIKGIQAELGKADKTEAKQFLMNVRAEIDELLSKFGGGGWLRDRRQVNQSEDYETRYEKKNNTGRTSYSKKKNSVASIFAGGGGVDSEHQYEEGVMISKPEYYKNTEGWFTSEGYAIYNKFADNWHAFFGVAKNLKITKKDALKKANAYYDYMKGVKTEKEYDKKDEEFRQNWKKQFGVGGGVNSLLEERRSFLQELIDNGIIDEEHYYFEETTDAINSNDDEQMRVLIDEMVSSDIIDKSYPDYKRALKLSKKHYEVGGGVDDLREGSKIGFLRENGRYEWADVLSIEGDNVNLVVRHPKRRQWDNYFTETKERIRRFINEFSEDWKDGRYVMKIKYDTGGFVQTYNITQGNMSSSSVNPSQFGEGGDIPPYEGERFSQEEFDYRLNLAKSQIISDIMNGTVDPTKVNDFGDLGAFVDHNYYGGFIEDDYVHSEGFVFEMSVQDALVDWVEEGGINKALENPEIFAVGGSVEDQISYADARIYNLKELRSVSNEDMRENIDFQIEAIENQKAKLLSGELVPRKKLFGLF